MGNAVRCTNLFPVRCYALTLRTTSTYRHGSEYRLKERIGNRVMAVANPLLVGPLRKYRSVATVTVARAMLACAAAGRAGVHIVESDRIQDLGG
jgi:hypothetical protein